MRPKISVWGVTPFYPSERGGGGGGHTLFWHHSVRLRRLVQVVWVPLLISFWGVIPSALLREGVTSYSEIIVWYYCPSYFFPPQVIEQSLFLFFPQEERTRPVTVDPLLSSPSEVHAVAGKDLYLSCGLSRPLTGRARVSFLRLADLNLVRNLHRCSSRGSDYREPPPQPPDPIVVTYKLFLLDPP